MSGYSSNYGLSATSNVLACSNMGVIASGTKQMRIVKIEATGASGGTFVMWFYSGASMSGGVSLTPVPLRQSAAATSVTARAGSYNVGSGATSLVSMSGTAKFLRSQSTAAGASGDYTFPFDQIINPGSGLFLVCTNTSGTATYFGSISVYFEELNLARSN